jgi:hypothetical protein
MCRAYGTQNFIFLPIATIITSLRDSKPETRNQKPETRNPKPETRNQKPETRNPKPETDPSGFALTPDAFVFLMPPTTERVAE